MTHKPSRTATTTAMEADSHETTPLIGDSRRGGTAERIYSPLLTCLIMVAVITLLQSGDQLTDSPITRLIESVACYRYYEKHDPSQLLTSPGLAGPGALKGTTEMQCKVNAIQAEVANIRSYQNFYDGIPALLLAIPYGWLQDRYGRRPFIIVGVLAFIFKTAWLLGVLWFWQAFPDLRWMWLSSLHALIMGGSPVVSALIMTMIADVTTAKQRATYLSRVGAGSMATMVIIPPISAWLMSFNPWIPCAIGSTMIFLAAILALAMPETLNYEVAEDDPDDAIISAIPIETVVVNEEAAILSSSDGVLHTIRTGFGFLWEDKRVPAAIAPFAIHILIMQTTQLLVQYASKRYHFLVAKATVLVTIRAAFLVVVLFSLLPWLSNILIDKYGLSIKYKDLLITKGSFSIMALGWALIGIAPTFWLFAVGLVTTALGTGFIVTLRSFLTTLVRKDQVARLFSILSVVDALGMMFGSVILAKFFDLGMDMGGIGVGLPFFVLSAVCCFFLLLLLTLVKLRKDERGMIDLLAVEDDL